MADDKPPAVDALLMSQRMAGAGGGAPASDDAPKPSKDDTVNNSSNFIERIFGIKIDALFATGLLAHIKLPQSWVDKMVNQGGAQLNARGGSGANFLMESVRISTLKDYSKLTKPAIEGMPVQNIPITALGNLTPLNTSSGRGSSGRSV